MSLARFDTENGCTATGCGGAFGRCRRDLRRSWHRNTTGDHVTRGGFEPRATSRAGDPGTGPPSDLHIVALWWRTVQTKKLTCIIHSFRSEMWGQEEEEAFTHRFRDYWWLYVQADRVHRFNSCFRSYQNAHILCRKHVSSTKARLLLHRPHTVCARSKLLTNSRQTGIEIVHEPGLDRGIIHLQHPCHDAQLLLLRL